MIGNRLTSVVSSGNLELIKNVRANKLADLVRDPFKYLAKDLGWKDKINYMLAVCLLFGIELCIYFIGSRIKILVFNFFFSN